jgi:hypothetical protein
MMEIGMCGTFDVQNYGDLLFPLIAQAELTRRLGPITLHRFSYFEKALPDWPYRVTSIAALPKVAEMLDGMIIGGGHLIRFDKQVAPIFSAHARYSSSDRILACAGIDLPPSRLSRRMGRARRVGRGSPLGGAADASRDRS